MNTRKLIDFVSSLNKGEMLYQYPDCLLEVIGDSQTPLAEEKQNLIDVISQAQSIENISKSDAKCYGFDDLADWANDIDYLLLVGDDLLLCISPMDKTKVA